MSKPLTRCDALRRILEGRKVPPATFGLLLRDGLFRLCRDRPMVTGEGRALLRAYEAAA